jgi:hypothetical protein
MDAALPIAMHHYIAEQSACDVKSLGRQSQSMPVTPPS